LEELFAMANPSFRRIDLPNQSALGCRGLRNSSNFPGSLKLLIDLVGLVFASLRIQTIAQSGKRTGVARISLEIFAKDFLGSSCLICG
jgi:hypothetical protein